jgi:hypothetical protein
MTTPEFIDWLDEQMAEYGDDWPNPFAALCSRTTRWLRFLRQFPRIAVLFELRYDLIGDGVSLVLR